MLDIKKQIKDIEGKIEEKRAEAINESYKIERGSVSDEYLAYQSMMLIKAALESDSELQFIIQLDKNGVPNFLNIGRRR